MHFYRISGLLVSSEIELPGACAKDPGVVDVCIRRLTVPERLDDAEECGPTWASAGERFLLCIPGVARFLLIAGREIRFEAEGATTAHDIAIFVTGTVLGILLHQRAQVVLHASAVLVGRRAVLFCGPSGAGKSTMAAALNQRGYPIIADDVSALALDRPGVPLVLPDGRNLKLWRQASEWLGLERGPAVRESIEKHYIEPVSALSEAMPLGAIYALREARPPLAPGIQRPNVVDAALLLRKNAYRPALVVRMNQKTNYFQAATRAAAHVGIFYLTRVLDFAQMDAVIGWLEAHWAETGLTETV